MRLLDILKQSKGKTKIFVNPDEPLVKELVSLPRMSLPNVDLSCFGKQGGLLWFEDAAVPVGSFRLE